MCQHFQKYGNVIKHGYHWNDALKTTELQRPLLFSLSDVSVPLLLEVVSIIGPVPSNYYGGPPSLSEHLYMVVNFQTEKMFETIQDDGKYTRRHIYCEDTVVKQVKNI
jgi:hypothetical protein